MTRTRHLSILSATIVLPMYLSSASAQTIAEGNTMLESPAYVHFAFRGPIGDRVQANVDNWLLPAVDANPRILEMFRTRDRQPAPDLMPWAGEFVGKYLISAIQALRMTDDPRLKGHIERTITELISTQADDGYMGPWPKHERLLGHWDLWGHYHIMLALLMWYEDAGDQESLQCAIRMGDLVCDTFLDTERRVYDAGSYEMNMAIIHSLGWLYRITGTDRYLRMMREIEADFEKPGAGDYFRTGRDGIDFHRTPKPRWESLHDLQGLVELYRITGDASYRDSFVNHWRSIATHDIHPSGGYSTNEQSVGNPYSLGAIETCCTTAWMALTLDALKLTGEAWAADELELSTWNSMLGSQHPSGRWWTYDTPLDGARQASAHHIVFQARYGQPELNCCSVNAPRGLGILSEWAVLKSERGLAVNYYGPCTIRVPYAEGDVVLTQDTAYPADGVIRLTMESVGPRNLTLLLRIPGWAKRATVQLKDHPETETSPGTYAAVASTWRPGDTVTLRFDMDFRAWSGELAREGHAAIYRGPLLLAYDQRLGALDTHELPQIDLARLDEAEAEPAYVAGSAPRFKPILTARVPTVDGSFLTLCDFATAGAHGTLYRAWLPATPGRPAPFHLKRPVPSQAVAQAPVLFEWTGYGHSAEQRTYRLVVARDPSLDDVLIDVPDLVQPRTIAHDSLPEGEVLYWSVWASNAQGETRGQPALGTFTIDPSLENTVDPARYELKLGPDGILLSSSLDGTGEPAYGDLIEAKGISPAEDRHGAPAGAVRFSGDWSMIRYATPHFPEEELTFMAWVKPDSVSVEKLQQFFSAWDHGMDDPLRIGIDKGGLYARIEAGSLHGVNDVALPGARWFHIAAVRSANELTLYVNGEERGRCPAPLLGTTSAADVALGGNPHYTGENECFVGCLDDFRLYGRALGADEVRRAYETPGA